MCQLFGKSSLKVILCAIIALAGGAVSTFGSAPQQENSTDPDSLYSLLEIKNLALHKTHPYSFVRELSDVIGPRLTGSTGAESACKWALEKMKRIGLQEVHAEPWRLDHPWQRGIANADLQVPYHLNLNVSSYGWVGSTKKGGVEADVVAVNSDEIPKEISSKTKSWAGKILFLVPLSAKHVNPLRSFAQLGSLLSAASKVHAVAVISPSGRPGSMMTHTGPPTLTQSYFPMPTVDMAPEHQQLLQRLLATKQEVRIKLNVQNQVSPTSKLSSNIVGDIPGAEHPEEVVIVAAHLDSWDLGTGTVDDGVGTAAVLASAEAILHQRVRPLRTIRFVLFTGEEQGMLGSLAYQKIHQAELKNTLCAIAIDWGAGPIVKIPLAGHDELTGAIQHFAMTIQDLGNIGVDTSYLSFTDAYSFTLSGIPGIAPLQNSVTYPMVGHSASDTFDKVDRKTLEQNTAILATLAFWIANHPSRLGLRWTPTETKKNLTRDNQKPLLELMGLWSNIPSK